MRDFAKDREPKLLTHGQKAILERMAADVVRLQEFERDTINATLEMNLQAVSLVGSCMSLESTNEMLQRRIAELEAERDKLQRFKDWVHAYLDSHGVPHHPPGVHGAEGCRIGDRMDWLMRRLAEEEAQNVRLKEAMKKFCLDCSRDIDNCTCMVL